MKHIFFSILTALAFFHCKEPAPAPKNTLNCYVRFDAAGRNVKSEVSLYDGTTKKVMEIPGGISFQATPMKLLPLRGVTYVVEYPAAYTPEQVFEWTNKKGEKGFFKLNVPSIDSFYFDLPVLSVKKPANLEWIGAPLGKGETLVFMWENQAKGLTVPMEVSTTYSKPLIEIPAAKIAEVGPGNWTVYLVRKRLGKSETPEYMVDHNAEYYTKPISVKIAE
jgi:hypothetical protein